jgi:anionic cell wall polymer biosynthesis LytR-Cps2A-Psr (LCP) family protein
MRLGGRMSVSGNGADDRKVVEEGTPELSGDDGSPAIEPALNQELRESGRAAAAKRRRKKASVTAKKAPVAAKKAASAVPADAAEVPVAKPAPRRRAARPRPTPPVEHEQTPDPSPPVAVELEPEPAEPPPADPPHLPEVVHAGRPPIAITRAVLRHRLLLVVIVLLAAAVAGLSLSWRSYNQLTSDLNSSNAHVPTGVRSALTPTGAVTADPTVILFEGVNLAQRPRGSLLLLRVDPGRHVLSTLAVPPTTRVPGSVTLGQALAGAGSQGALALLSAAGIPVAHIALVDLPQLNRTVNELGGVTIDNPAQLVYTRPDGSRGVIPAGRVALTGASAESYVRPRMVQTATRLASSEQRQNIVLRGLIEKMLRPTSLSAVEAIGRVVATTVATDLSASQVLDLASVRLGANRFVECTLPPGGSFADSSARAALGEFQRPAPGASPTTACSWRPIAPAPGGVVGTISRAVVQNIPFLLLAMLASTSTMLVLALLTLAVLARRSLVGVRTPALAGSAAPAPLPIAEYRAPAPTRAAPPPTPATPPTHAPRARRLPSMPAVKRPALPALPAVRRPRLSAKTPLRLPSVSRPSMPSVRLPKLPRLRRPGLPAIHRPSVPSVRLPSRPSLRPSSSRLGLPQLPRLELPVNLRPLLIPTMLVVAAVGVAAYALITLTR